jgi:hypothetical protein
MHSARHLVVAACGVSAIVHLALVPQQPQTSRTSPPRS